MYHNECMYMHSRQFTIKVIQRLIMCRVVYHCVNFLDFSYQVCVNRLLADWGCGPIVKDDFIHEMCRYGASEVHSVAAYIGGCAAQEVIKVITAQYVPINNTHIYNAIAATSGTFML